MTECRVIVVLCKPEGKSIVADQQGDVLYGTASVVLTVNGTQPRPCETDRPISRYSLVNPCLTIPS